MVMAKWDKVGRRRERGITLIEVLTAVGIIAVLATLALKSSSGFLDRGRTAKCTSNLRQIGMAMNIYQNENNGQYPAIRDASLNYWYQVLAPYLEGVLKSGSTTVGDARNVVKIFRCPSARQDFGAPSDDAIFRSYLATDFMRGVNPQTNAKDWSIPVKTVSIPKPALTLFLVDGAKTSSGTDYACDSGQSFSTAKISYRHTKKTNSLYLDGHVALLRSDEITKDMWDSP